MPDSFQSTCISVPSLQNDREPLTEEATPTQGVMGAGTAPATQVRPPGASSRLNVEPKCFMWYIVSYNA